jgi:hypothetical protein
MAQFLHQLRHDLTRDDRSITSQIVWFLILLNAAVLLYLLAGLLFG